MHETNKCDVFSVLKVYNFVKKSYTENDATNLNVQVETAAINALVRSDLLQLINYTNDNDAKPSFLELFPLVIQRIYKSNPNRTIEVLGFVDQVKNFTGKIKFLHVLLKEGVQKENIKHLSLILHRFKSIKSEINKRNVVPAEAFCSYFGLITSMEKYFPVSFKPYLSDNDVWLIKNLYINEYLHWYADTQFKFDLLYTDKSIASTDKSSWYIFYWYIFRRIFNYQKL